MIKGFVLFNEGRIPFVIDNYRMELFTADDSLMNDYLKQYNFKTNYVLEGLCFNSGIPGQKAAFLVDRSMGSICYLRCYIIYMISAEECYDTIGFQSPFLDDIFRYGYEWLDRVRAGINLNMQPQNVYEVPFSMNNREYELIFRIGHDNRMGLLEDFDRKGELLLSPHTDEIQECYDISTVLYRLAMFMMSYAEVPFKRITLYRNGIKAGWFYCPLASEDAFSGHDLFFRELDVMKFIPRILNNIAKDPGNEIVSSVPLGYLGTINSMFSTQRFMEQMTAFEYLFDKLHHQKAQDSRISLKTELEYMFDQFPELLSDTSTTSDVISTDIKEIRRRIAHGYTYYYDFRNDLQKQHLILHLDNLLKKMSLLLIGFTKEEISEYPLI